MSPLEFVKPKDVAPTLNMALFGPGGTGKTVAACSAPGPILYGNAEGETALLYARGLYGDDKIHEFPVSKAADLDALFLHMQGGCEEQTFVLDTIGETYQRLVEELAGTGRASLQNYGDVNTKLERFIRAIRDLPINVVILAHEQVDDEEGEVTRRPLTGGKKLPEKLVAMMDVVGYTAVVPATDDEPTKYVAQLVEAKGRRAKDRSGALGVTRALDLGEWIPVAIEAMRGGQQSLETAATESEETEKGEIKNDKTKTATASTGDGGGKKEGSK